MLDLENITDVSIAQLVELYSVEAPELQMKLKYKRASYEGYKAEEGILPSLSAIPDLMPRFSPEFLIISPASRAKWYAQTLHESAPDGTDEAYRTELAFNVDKGVQNYHIIHEDGSDLNRAEAIAVIAYFCQDQTLPQGYASEQKHYRQAWYRRFF